MDKPAGLSTHAPDHDKWGLAEWAQHQLGRKLWVVHRLDKTTTGAIVFATTAARAEELRQAFENHQVKKNYWFLTDRVSTELELTRQSRIEKRGSGFVSDLAGSPNARTNFKRLKRSPFFELWQAEPLSGKPHQVRLHAADAGLPIVGDQIYGGTPFPHLCLHAQSLLLPGLAPWTCPAPRFFERLGVLKDPALVQILASLDRRQRIFQFLREPTECLRLIHTELPDFRLDKFGPTLWLNWYREAAPSERDLERWDFVRTLLHTPIVIQKRQDRGQDPNSQQLWELGETPATWQATENGAHFTFRKEQGLSAGLFLDQRLNRARVRAQAADRRVLNLFSYTGGFSLVAALGGAPAVTTVDLSKNFIEWSKDNFRANLLDPEKYEWSAADSFVFLKGAAKRGRRWDLIVCDPPSFSRSGKSVFKLKEDLEDLIRACMDCLVPGGTLFFSCNLESVEAPQIQKRLQTLLPSAKIGLGEQDLDYELPNEPKSLKSFWIQI